MSADKLFTNDLKAEQNMDDLFASLTNIAYATPSADPNSPFNPKNIQDDEFVEDVDSSYSPKKKYKSRFFYTPTKSFDDELDESKAEIKPTTLALVDQEVNDRSVSYKEELTDELVNRIDIIREFFLKEIAPKMFAAQSGIVQARMVAELALGAQVDNTHFSQFERMLSTAVTVKMARFITEYLGLPKAQSQELLSFLKPNTNPFVIPVPLEQHERRQRPQVAKGDNPPPAD